MYTLFPMMSREYLSPSHCHHHRHCYRHWWGCTTWCTRGVEVSKPTQPCEFILRFSLMPSSVHTSTAMGLSQYRNSSEHTAQTNPIFLVYSLVSKEAIDYKYRLQCILLYPESWFSYWDGLQLPPYPVLK